MITQARDTTGPTGRQNERARPIGGRHDRHQNSEKIGGPMVLQKARPQSIQNISNSHHSTPPEYQLERKRREKLRLTLELPSINEVQWIRNLHRGHCQQSSQKTEQLFQEIQPSESHATPSQTNHFLLKLSLPTHYFIDENFCFLVAAKDPRCGQGLLEAACWRVYLRRIWQAAARRDRGCFGVSAFSLEFRAAGRGEQVIGRFCCRHRACSKKICRDRTIRDQPCKAIGWIQIHHD